MLKYKQITEIPQEYLEKKIAEFLYEDKADNDITTKLSVPDTMQSVANIEAQDELVFVGKNIIKCIFKECEIAFFVNDGDVISDGTAIAKLSGNAAYILSRERVMLNLIQRLSGIATAAKKYSDIAKPFNVKVLDTRKTTPGLRLFEKYAINIGGGTNHRFDLESNILIKDNHISAAGGIENVIENITKNNYNHLQIELEVSTIKQLKRALELGIRGFLLDNMKPEMIKECVKIVRSYPNGDDIFVEASGGITYETLAEYVTTGVNAISTGALTHRIKSANIHLIFME
jgi:nicotinate-nucleotide pyrophosphorylase (carboxylating)